MLAAARDPNTLAVAVDASADAMRDGSRKALRARLANAMFVVAAVEALPIELAGGADLVTVHFPWGSLLRGILTGDGLVISNLASLARDRAELRMLVSVEARDQLSPCDPGAFGRLEPLYREHGLELLEARAARAEAILASRSSWAKRLGAARRRVVTLARFRRSS